MASSSLVRSVGVTLGLGLARFLLAVTIVLAHVLGGGLVGGRYAVQLFFVVSGFLISYVLDESRAYSKPRDFFINRALRIFPLYYLVAALTLLALTITSGSGNNFVGAFQEMPLSARFVVGLSDLTLLGQDQVMFMSVSDGILFWSVGLQIRRAPLVSGPACPTGMGSKSRANVLLDRFLAFYK